MELSKVNTNFSKVPVKLQSAILRQQLLTISVSKLSKDDPGYFVQGIPLNDASVYYARYYKDDGSCVFYRLNHNEKAASNINFALNNDLLIYLNKELI